MADDKYDILGPLYGDMGGELAEIVAVILMEPIFTPKPVMDG